MAAGLTRRGTADAAPPSRLRILVPVTGDFSGPKAIRAIGSYVRAHDGVVTTFYLSNVEQYLFQSDTNWRKYYANIATLRARFPDGYGGTGFFDAINPTTGAVGHRQLVLDQSMIMAALDNALTDRALQRHFASDQVSWAARTYLGVEDMGLN